MKRSVLFLICLMLGVAGFAAQSQAVPVGLELLLLVDVSGSVDDSEYDLQKTGYVNAFNDPSIHAAIENITGGIAVSYVEWSGATQQSIEVGWSHLTDAASSSAFAASISGATRNFSGVTAPGSAINFGVGYFTNNFEGARKVIDVSGDGSQNSGDSTPAARDAAFAAGFVINGLPILGSESGLDTWYADNLITSDGFLVAASGFTTFGDAVIQKIGREIQPPSVPEPGTMLLLGLGLAGLAGLRRRTR